MRRRRAQVYRRRICNGRSVIKGPQPAVHAGSIVTTCWVDVCLPALRRETMSQSYLFSILSQGRVFLDGLLDIGGFRDLEER